MLTQPESNPRKLGLGAAIAVVTGESIALGIFLTPAAMAKSLGSPLLLAAVWLSMGAMALSGALCYAELAVRYPESGGEYVYLRNGFSEKLAFLYGWMSAIVMYPGVAAALAVGGAEYVVALVPMGQHLKVAVPAALLLLFASVNILGTRLSGRVLAWLNNLKFLVLFALVACVFLSGHGHIANLLPLVARSPGSGPLIPAIAGAAISAFFSFGGWWEAGKIGGEVRNPSRNLPIAFLGGVLLVTAVYLLISFAFLAVLPIASISSSVAFVTQFGEIVFGPLGARLLSGCVLLCVCGGMAALTMTAPRVIVSMARHGEFFALFGEENKRFQTPANAILLQTGLSLVLLLLGSFDRILSCIIFCAVTFLALTVATLFRLPGQVSAWWYPAAPNLFIAFSFAINLLILLHDPVPALIGVGIVLCGLPLRRIVQRQPAAVSPLVIERT